ncbi:MAG: cation:proton antiporter [Halorhodospira sp.]
MEILQEVTILLIAAVIAAPLFQWLGLGSTLGYLAAGVVIGPHMLGLFSEAEELLDLSKVGVLLLLFLVGLELAPSKLLSLRRDIFGLGTLQVVATVAPIGAVTWWLGADWQTVVLVAFGLAFPSTAFALQVLSERGELGARHGQAAYAVLLFKYLAILPLMVAIPLVGAGLEGVSGTDLVRGAVQTVTVLAAVVIGGHYLLRPLFRTVAATGATEAFTAAALLVVLGTAVVIEAAGLEMALGAFLAGVLLADSEYRHEIYANINPFKGLLLGLFFLAVGMSADLGLLASMPLKILTMTAGLLVLKLAVTYGVGRFWGLEPVGASKFAAALPQGGELAFVLFSLATSYGVMQGATADITIAVVTLSMAATPPIVALNERFVAPRLDGDTKRAYDEPGGEEGPGVVIAGFGRFGQMMGRLLHSSGIRFTALDANPKHVDFIRRFGNEIFYADAAKPEVLQAVRAGEADAFILAMDRVDDSMRIAETLRRNYPNVPLYAIASDAHHAWHLRDLRAEGVVREAFTVSLELGEEVLAGLGWSAEAAREAVHSFRDHDAVLMDERYAVQSERTSLKPDDDERAAELENLFEADLDEEPIDADYGQGASIEAGERA